jgi:hypothetical protein
LPEGFEQGALVSRLSGAPQKEDFQEEMPAPPASGFMAFFLRRLRDPHFGNRCFQNFHLVLPCNFAFGIFLGREPDF